MMTTYTRPPEQAGKYRYETHINGERVTGEAWYFPREPRSICWFTPDGKAPDQVDYAGIPGTLMSDWPKHIDDEGALRLMCAIIKRAKLDAFCEKGGYPRIMEAINQDRETAIWFLSASGAGRRWLREEEEFRTHPEWRKLRKKQKAKERKERAARKYKIDRLEKISWRDYLDL